MSVYHPEPRIVCESRGECAKCGSIDKLAVIDYRDGFYRKECLECGSTGPFLPRRATPGARRQGRPWCATSRSGNRSEDHGTRTS